MTRPSVVTRTTDPTPLYHQFQLHLRRRIERGEWKPGDRLPTEPELAREYGLSRSTVREGLDRLARDGLIERHPGRGTFLRDDRIVSEWSAFYWFLPSLRALGHNVTPQVVSLQIKQADAHVVELLDVAPDEPVVHLKRLILVDNEPFLVIKDHVAERLCPGLIEVDFSRELPAEILESRFGIRITRRERWIEPIIPSLPDQDLLALPSGTPCLLMDQLNWSSDGKPVDFVNMIVRGDRCRHYVQLSGV